MDVAIIDREDDLNIIKQQLRDALLQCGAYEERLRNRDRELEAAKAKIAELEEVMRWIPVTERLPEDDEEKLVKTDGEYPYHIGFYACNLETPNWYDFCTDKKLNVVEWRKLPDPVAQGA